VEVRRNKAAGFVSMLVAKVGSTTMIGVCHSGGSQITDRIDESFGVFEK
jgi:hypothetical protein